jgi:succinoglycan biosynthesis protein ExoO
MDVFETVCIRGSIRLGRFLILLDPFVALRGAIAVLDQLLARTGLAKRRLGRPAPYSIAVPLSRRDIAFLRSRVPPVADLLVLDYAFLTPCIALVGTKRPSIVIMHDLFSARAPQFDSLDQSDSAARLSEPEEMALLSGADLVVAIQEDEAAIVRKWLPRKRVVVAPMAAQPVAHPHPGDSDTVLFVGSNTAPNIDGLRWFINEAWPRISEQRLSSRLLVAGSVVWSYAPQVAGVRYLGFVPNLDDLYRRAGVVISPLRVGSGLKVKLVEALSWGKAVVATSVTTQGVGPLLDKAVVIADDPDDFASDVVALMNDTEERARYGARALQVATRHFGEDSCYGGILSFIAECAAAKPLDEPHQQSALRCNVAADQGPGGNIELERLDAPVGFVRE